MNCLADAAGFRSRDCRWLLTAIAASGAERRRRQEGQRLQLLGRGTTLCLAPAAAAARGRRRRRVHAPCARSGVVRKAAHTAAAAAGMRARARCETTTGPRRRRGGWPTWGGLRLDDIGTGDGGGQARACELCASETAGNRRRGGGATWLADVESTTRDEWPRRAVKCDLRESVA